jgi:hypothetical protein
MIKKQIMRQEIFDLIREDLPLRQAIAMITGTTDNNIRVLCINSSKKLSEYNVVNVIKHHTGYKDNQIFKDEES